MLVKRFSLWWNTIDRTSFGLILFMIAFGAIMVATTSPAIADRIGVESLYFIRRQIIFLSIAIVVLLVTSMMSVSFIEKITPFAFTFGIIALVVVLFKGIEIKGATRWFSILGISVQPSEFIKPFFSLFIAWLLSKKSKDTYFPAFIFCSLSYLTIMTLLVLQPDIGMAVTITAIWSGQLFIAGLSLIWIIFAAILAIMGGVSAYLFLPHVTTRIDKFLNPTENYQIERSLDAFASGGIYGKGPGEGVVKQFLPDSHTDFIFAVIGEELGLIACLLIIIIFCIFVLRSFANIKKRDNFFVIFAASGLIIQFAIQAFINIGVTLNLLPTKGMTLPFISYGGSSMVAMAIATGILIAITRHQYGITKQAKWKT